ncbi:GNAT family N-acetyltransferase [Persicobacter psychrovividus]|uniref:N-acetyltransferase n=1 Tax=Persicobacter psychrovividus TaxID=387638 RepID=A0ABM7VJJ0_9BACT|nr:N-acetyltransferase [Persicobacter psychrovividus]
MIYRKATEKDLNKVAELFDSYRVFYRKESNLQGAKAFLKERIERNDAEIFVAEVDHKLVGFVQLYPLFSSTKMKKFWLLNDLFVHPNHRGKGISIGLIARAKKLVKETGACGMSLETDKSNLIGNSLYPKEGFELNESCNFYEWSNSSGSLNDD